MATVIFFLPAILCLLFGFQFVFRKKNITQRYLMYLHFSGALYFVAYAFYISPSTNYTALCMLDSISEPALLLTISLFIAYIHLYIYTGKDNSKRKKKITTSNLQWFAFPALILGAINMLMYYLIGFEQCGKITEECDRMNMEVADPVILATFKEQVDISLLRLFGLFNHTIFSLMAVVYASILILSCCYVSIKNEYRFGDVFRFFCLKQETCIERAVSTTTMMVVISLLPMLVIGRIYFINHLWASIVMTMFISISLFFLTNVEMMSQRKRFTLHGIVTSSFTEAGITFSDEDEGKHTRITEDNVFQKDLVTVRTNHIIEKMHQAFETEKAYTNPELTVAAMAEMIGTNRTTLSNIVNQQYGVTFRDLANRYRIDAAKDYILQHPMATQEEIAVACGFRSASAFNHKFKEIEGMPPTLWLAARNTPPK